MKTSPVQTAPPAANFIANYGKFLNVEHGSKLEIVDNTTVRVRFTDADGYNDDQGAMDASYAASGLNSTVDGVKLLFTDANGKPGYDGGFSLDDELGHWLWDLPGTKDAEMHSFKDGKVGLLVRADKGVDPKLLDNLIADSYSDDPIRVAGSSPLAPKR